jgi:hypothetical protein
MRCAHLPLAIGYQKCPPLAICAGHRPKTLAYQATRGALGALRAQAPRGFCDSTRPQHIGEWGIVATYWLIAILK